MRHLSVLILCFACAGTAHATSPAPIALASNGPQANSSAVFKDKVLQLTGSVAWQVGSCFPARIYPGRFDVTFSFKLSQPSPEFAADGLTFCIHNDPRGPRAIGAGGGLMGYGKAEFWNVGGIEKSIAVEFDPYYNEYFSDPEYEHIGVNIDGAMASAKTAKIPFPVTGGVVHARIVYDSRVILVYAWPDGSKPGEPLLRCEADVMGVLKSGTAWAGFTAATGTYWQTHEILQYKLGGK